MATNIEAFEEDDLIWRLIFKNHIAPNKKILYPAFMAREKDQDGLSFNLKKKCVDKDTYLLRSREHLRKNSDVCEAIVGDLKTKCDSYVKYTPSKGDDSHISVGPTSGMLSILSSERLKLNYATQLAMQAKLVL